MHKFKFGDKVKVHGRKGIYIKTLGKLAYIIYKRNLHGYFPVFPEAMSIDYAGTFTLRKARVGWRYNVRGLNNENITTSQVLKAKQSATEMHERHYRDYKLVDKTVKG